MQRRRVLGGFLGLVGLPLRAREKWSLIPGSDAIVCGRIERFWRVPWFDGWHMWGTIQVERVLKGRVREGDRLSYRFRCDHCDLRGMWDIHPDLYKPSIWYVCKDGDGNWSSASDSYDMGQRPMQDLPGLIEVLRKYGPN
jgi:hypothetical protein